MSESPPATSIDGMNVKIDYPTAQKMKALRSETLKEQDRDPEAASTATDSTPINYPIYTRNLADSPRASKDTCFTFINFDPTKDSYNEVDRGLNKNLLRKQNEIAREKRESATIGSTTSSNPAESDDLPGQLKSGRFSTQENIKFYKAVLLYGMDYGKVATVLNRTKDSIYAHYKNEFKNNPGAIADALDLEDYAGAAMEWNDDREVSLDHESEEE